jgi:hypothetical protein
LIKPARALVLLPVAALALAACGGGSSKTQSADSPQTNIGAGAESQPAVGSSDSSGSGTSPADVDVCALLSQADADSVARTHGLDGAQTDATVYTLTATKQTDTGIEPTSSCKFTIASQGGAQGTVVFQVGSAKSFSLYSSGKKLDGLGDEAYDNDGSTVMRVGDLMLSAGEDSLPDDFTADLMRKMAPHLK